VLLRVTQAVGATNPDCSARSLGDAERIAQSIRWHRAQALSGIVEAAVDTDPDHAERITRSIADRKARAQALSAVARVLNVTIPDDAARLFADAEDVARSIADGKAKAKALSAIDHALVVVYPERAGRIRAEPEHRGDARGQRGSRLRAPSLSAPQWPHGRRLHWSAQTNCS
jgi:hypothetical protein